MKNRPTMTSEESKTVGWDDDMIDRWPGTIVRQIVIKRGDRLQLIRWVRFLDSPTTDEERATLEEIVKVLRDTLPTVQKKTPEPTQPTDVEVSLDSKTKARLEEETFLLDKLLDLF